MLLGDLRAEITRICGQLAADGLVVGTSGNVSARCSDEVFRRPGR